MTRPVSGGTSGTGTVNDTGTTGTQSKNQTGGTSEGETPPQGAKPITNSSQLAQAGITQAQIAAALNMAGGSPYITLRGADGSLYFLSTNQAQAWMQQWGWNPGQLGEGANPGEPPPYEMGGDEAMYQQWQDGGGVGTPGSGYGGTASKAMGGGGSGYYYGPGGYTGNTGGTGGNYYGDPYASYGQPGNPVFDQVFGGVQKDQVYAQRREMRKAESQLKVKMRMIMLQLLMGDIVGAMRSMVFESEKLNRMFNRQIVSQLNKVRESKAKVLNAMARKDPPRAHNNTNNPQGAANDQNKQAKYTQWVSVSTQLMSEIQQTERELMDLLSEGRRNINELWEAYSGLKESEARTTRTVIQAFRS